MHWPADHPLHHDEVLAAFAAAADELCARATVLETFRYVPGRRVTTLIDVAGRPAVLKIFANPRARGNHRRLRAMELAGLGAIVPRSLGCDRSGHVGLISFRPGAVLDTLADARFVDASGRAGVALRRLHDSAAALDRVWTRADEVRLLRKRAPQSMQHVLDGMDLESGSVDDGPLVTSHRDCHPRQLVHTGGDVAWIDLDDAAMAPAALDVGNLVAHLTREAVTDRRSISVAVAEQEAFLAGYRWPAGGSGLLAQWVQLALLRLAGLAESRHGSPGERDALLIEAQSLRLLPGVAIG